MEPMGIVHAEYDYAAQQEEELDMAEGDGLELIENDDPDWYLVKLNGVIGLVPSNYVSFDTQEAGIQAQEPDHMPAPPLPVVTPQTAQVNKECLSSLLLF
jgi:hypothetical protein